MSISCLLPLTVSIMFMGVSSACSHASVLSNLQIYRPSYFKIRECGQRPLFQDIRRRKRVTNGDDASLGQWPWHVNIQQNGGTPCSGVLIDSDWVVTAAHCFYNKKGREVVNAANLTVTAGTLDDNGMKDAAHSETAEVRLVADVYMHPKYATERTIDNHDFMMLKLAEPFIIGSNIQTACVQIKEDVFQPGAECYVAGWGQHYRSNRGHISPSLQYSSVPLLTQSDCRYYAGNVSRYQLSLVTEQKLCAGVWSTDIYGPCKGDSGGPLICFENTSRSWYVTGVVSHGPKCGEIGFYTKVHAMVDFIEEVIFGTFTNDNYLCTNGVGEIAVERKCDGVADCADLSDETDCECTEKQFRCDNGICRMLADLCDAEDDCGDQSDEAECEYFQCHDDRANIGLKQVCDGIRDCEKDWSDEDPDVCECNPDSHFQCTAGPCIPLTWRCDGEIDCIETETDEIDCDCRPGYFSCSNGRCAHNNTICNGNDDCGDKSDEQDCPNPCEEGSIVCDVLGSCAAYEWFSCDNESVESICAGDDLAPLMLCFG